MNQYCSNVIDNQRCGNLLKHLYCSKCRVSDLIAYQEALKIKQGWRQSKEKGRQEKIEKNRVEIKTISHGQSRPLAKIIRLKTLDSTFTSKAKQ